MGLDKINELKKAKGLTNLQLAELSGVTLSTLDKITSGNNTNPKLSTLQAICRILGCSLDDLDDTSVTDSISSKEHSIIKKYRTLDEYGKKAIDSLLEIEVARIEKANLSTSETIQLFPMVEYLQPASAGTGQYLDDSSFTNLTLVKEPPRGASYIVRVKGDSMEPTYSDGDRVFVGTTYEIRIGDVGLFWADGDVYIKERGEDGLISHNCKYPLIRCNGYRDIRPLGKILGKCTEEYLTKK